LCHSNVVQGLMKWDMHEVWAKAVRKTLEAFVQEQEMLESRRKDYPMKDIMNYHPLFTNENLAACLEVDTPDEKFLNSTPKALGKTPQEVFRLLLELATSEEVATVGQLLNAIKEYHFGLRSPDKAEKKLIEEVYRCVCREILGDNDDDKKAVRIADCAKLSLVFVPLKPTINDYWHYRREEKTKNREPIEMDGIRPWCFSTDLNCSGKNEYEKRESYKDKVGKKPGSQRIRLSTSDHGNIVVLTRGARDYLWRDKIDVKETRQGCQYVFHTRPAKRTFESLRELLQKVKEQRKNTSGR